MPYWSPGALKFPLGIDLPMGGSEVAFLQLPADPKQSGGFLRHFTLAATSSSHPLPPACLGQKPLMCTRPAEASLCVHETHCGVGLSTARTQNGPLSHTCGRETAFPSHYRTSCLSWSGAVLSKQCPKGLSPLPTCTGGVPLPWPPRT